MPDPHSLMQRNTHAAAVYKIVQAADWLEACKSGAYGGSKDDARDGFIHLSAAHQVPGTLAKHFAGQDNLLLIAFAQVSLGQALKWEPSCGGGLFPHHYGPLPTALALWQRPLQLGAAGVAIVEEDWFRC